MAKWIICGEEQIIGNGNPVIKDINLDQEVVIVDGERLTEARAEQISEEIMEVVYKHYGMKFTPRKLDN
jgi:predicted hydrolase (HD superfamily)